MNRPIVMGGFLLTMAGTCHAQIAFSGSTVLTFASAAEGRKILTTPDDFIRVLSPFDRAARVKREGDISEKEFLEFIGQNVLDWTEMEKTLLVRALDRLKGPLDRLALPWPAVVYAVKTTGAEEGGVPYTRDRALILPQRMLAPGRVLDARLVAHELFHILSRSNPAVRHRLYQAIGFVTCADLEFPESLKNRKLTNPDAPRNDHCIRVQVAGTDVWAVPILFSKTEKYDIRRGGEFFRYLQSQLLLVDRQGDSPEVKPRYVGSRPQLVEFDQATGFYEQVGRNTEYIIHPEEILADNFAALVMQDPLVRSPEILKRLQDVLAERPAPETK